MHKNYDALANRMKDALRANEQAQHRLDITVPYDHNPVVMLVQQFRAGCADGVDLLYRRLACAGVYGGGQLFTFGRELNAARATKLIRYGNKFTCAEFNRMAKYVIHHYPWGAKPFPEQWHAHRQVERVAWAVVGNFPDLRDYSHPNDPVLLPAHGGLKLIGMPLAPVK